MDSKYTKVNNAQIIGIDCGHKSWTAGGQSTLSLPGKVILIIVSAICGKCGNIRSEIKQTGIEFPELEDLGPILPPVPASPTPKSNGTPKKAN